MRDDNAAAVGFDDGVGVIGVAGIAAERRVAEPARGVGVIHGRRRAHGVCAGVCVDCVGARCIVAHVDVRHVRDVSVSGIGVGRVEVERHVGVVVRGVRPCVSRGVSVVGIVAARSRGDGCDDKRSHRNRV
jgi:hypothetical protein